MTVPGGPTVFSVKLSSINHIGAREDAAQNAYNRKMAKHQGAIPNGLSRGEVSAAGFDR